MSNIKPKKGICKDCTDNKEKYLIAGRCKYHYWQYRNSLRAIKEKKKGPTQMEVFMEIWKESNNCSQISGRSLNTFYLKYLAKDKESMFPNCFAHIIAKGKESSLKTLKENILLVHPEEHTLLDQGTKDRRKKYEEEWNCSFDIFYDKKIELIKKYVL